MPVPTYQPVIGVITSELFKAEYRRLDKGLNDIRLQNNEIRGGNFAGFMFQGVWYKPVSMNNVPRGKDRPLLSESLELMMLAHMADCLTIANHKQQITQVIFQLIHQATTTQEVRDALPDCLIECVRPEYPEIAKLQRHMTNCTWLIQNNKYAMKAYEKTLPLIEMYSVTKLLY